jgi:hypothetical protein
VQLLRLFVQLCHWCWGNKMWWVQTFHKIQIRGIKVSFFFSTGIAAYPLGGHSALQIDHINKNRKSSEDSSTIMLRMYKYMRTVWHKMYMVSHYRSKSNHSQILRYKHVTDKKKGIEDVIVQSTYIGACRAVQQGNRTS